MVQSNNLNNFINYSVTYLLIAISGLPFFFYGSEGTIGILSYLLIVLIYLLATGQTSINLRIKTFFGIYFLVFLAVWGLQYFGCGFFPILNFTKFLAKLLLVFIALIILKESIFKLYINTIFVLGIIGLIIHGLALTVPPFFDFCIGSIAPHIPNQAPEIFQVWHNQQIIIHDFWQIDLGRNSGPFWEPGANAGFTLLALFFNMFIFRAKLFSKKNILFILVVLSTLSTTGFLVLITILFLNPQYNKRMALKIFSLVVILGLSAWAFLTFDFLADKLQQQMDKSSATTAHASRFASAQLDLKTFSEYPFGFSNYDYRKGKKVDDDYRTNGVFILLAGVGFVAFTLYFILIFIGFKRVLIYFNSTRSYNLEAFYFVIVVVIMSFSENYFERPLFIGFSLLAPFFITKTYRIRLNTDELKDSLLGPQGSKTNLPGYSNG